ncbi:MAG: methyltransferase domain-containing protein [Dehalococcoidales bacterium]|nr:methyltransferase domain-containing protein [Dehalococcoidales bacterium]
MHKGFLGLPEEERRRWQNPDEILTGAGLQSGMTFVDIGCGQGFFTLPAAKIVGNEGKVYALDISQENIAVLVQKSRATGLGNITSLTAEAENSVLCEACADMVFFGIVLHDFRDPLKVLSNAHRMLKPGGTLVNLDWKKEPTPFGPPEHIRFSEAKAGQLITSQGFKIASVNNTGMYHYLITAEPQ